MGDLCIKGGEHVKGEERQLPLYLEDCLDQTQKDMEKSHEASNCAQTLPPHRYQPSLPAASLIRPAQSNSQAAVKLEHSPMELSPTLSIVSRA